jgi:uncharacterized protein YndB with AHSA1/START domain
MKPLLEQAIDIDAPPAKVWAIVSDPTAIARFSPQVIRTFVRGGAVRKGTEMFNLNHKGLLVWPTRAKVVEFDPERRFAFRVKDNKSIWSFTLEPTERGTRVIHRRETPDGTSQISDTLVDKVMGGQEDFTASLLSGMGATLRGVKAQAERIR